MASALIELSQLDPSELAPQWLALAKKQLRTLSAPEYLAKEGEQGGFIIKHGVGFHRAGAEVDVPLTYGDYYYVEALMRMKQLLAKPTGMELSPDWGTTSSTTRTAISMLTTIAPSASKASRR